MVKAMMEAVVVKAATVESPAVKSATAMKSATAVEATAATIRKGWYRREEQGCEQTNEPADERTTARHQSLPCDCPA
jgi:hypothetical protein